MGSFTFTFKKPINYAYAPGRTKAGMDGVEGNAGTDGNAVYFIDYELNNSYIIELVQQKLENNYMLSGESELISDKRGYHAGDIIISNQGNCYMIIEDTNSYYTYNIKYMGRIAGKNMDESPKSITEVRIYEFKTHEYQNTQIGFMPSNRQFLVRSANNRNMINVDPNYTVESDVYNLDNAFLLNGVWYKFVVVTDSSFGEDVEFTVELELHNKKTYQADSVGNPPGGDINLIDPTDQPLYQLMKFNKNMEFRAPSICESDEPISELEIAEYGGVKPAYISDMSLDKMHLFNNDIKSPVFRVDDDIYCSHSSNDGPITEVGLMTDSDIQTMMKSRVIPVNSSVWKYALYSMFLPDNYMTTNENNINWRGGESAYFSSCPDSLVLRRIREFLDKESSIRVISHNNRTEEINIFDNVRVVKIDVTDTGLEMHELNEAQSNASTNITPSELGYFERI